VLRIVTLRNFMPRTALILRHPNNHVAFGDGIHACIGAHLARLQGKIVLGSVVERFSRLRLSAPEQPLHTMDISCRED
jgi:cytochrome P450 PksS